MPKHGLIPSRWPNSFTPIVYRIARSRPKWQRAVTSPAAEKPTGRCCRVDRLLVEVQVHAAVPTSMAALEFGGHAATAAQWIQFECGG
jgi:hypothetical protein